MDPDDFLDTVFATVDPGERGVEIVAFVCVDAGEEDALLREKTVSDFQPVMDHSKP